MDQLKKRICRDHPMHIVLLADDSGSMKGKPAQDVTLGIRTWLSELQAASAGGTKCYFLFSFVVFGSHARAIVSATNLNDIEPEEIAVEGASGKTNMAEALAVAREVLSADRSTPAFCPPFVFLYTDGHADDRDRALEQANLLKDMRLSCGTPQIVTLGFGDSTDDDLLARLATSPELYKKTRDASELAMLLPAIGTPTTAGAGATVDAFRRRIAAARPENIEQLEI